MKKAIFLFDYTGIMAKPWADAGYLCYCFDGQHPKGVSKSSHENILNVGVWFGGNKIDVESILLVTGDEIAFVFGFPECTFLSCSGAGWLYHPDDKRLPTSARRPHPLHPNRKKLRAEAVELAKMVSSLGESAGCAWAIENPMSQLSTLWRKPNHRFHPREYGGYLREGDIHPIYPNNIPAQDAYNKTTWIWCGEKFIMPIKREIKCELRNGADFVMGRNDGLGGKSLKTKNIRSATPRGFAQAVFEANIK